MTLPIKHWSHSSLTAYLRNPLAWYKRYVENVRDTPSSPSSIVGRAGHIALQHFYGGIEKEGAIDLGLEHLRSYMDTEINFGVAKTKTAKRAKRRKMEAEYLQAIGFYLAKPPKHDVLAIEHMAIAPMPAIGLSLKAISDLVVKSKSERGAIDIVDHKFVQSFSKEKAAKTLFIIQAIFNYYTVKFSFPDQPIRRFIVHECKVSKNADGSPQMRRYVIKYDECQAEFALFHRLLRDATKDLALREVFLPNPSDLYEGEQSVLIYNLGL